MPCKLASGRDGGESDYSVDSDSDNDQLSTPLFAHESFGAYDFGQQDAKDQCCDVAVKSPLVNSPLVNSPLVKQPRCHADIDPNDPTLEKFPTETLSVLSTLRKIQSCHDDNRAYLHAQSPSPDTVDHDYNQTAASASIKRADKRLSHSPLSHPRTCSALGAIAEEPKTCGDGHHSKAQAALEHKDRRSHQDICSPDIAVGCYQGASGFNPRAQE
ncbi:hypothetical protein CDD82_5955 [Ophiocordyceps australis]|uniref:Uncharacterized protein n=1 Tax=Ophiocordyceps australis TaxID=1399860 RepID=A0A2C5ZN09_9HYPO|nr:hypothetical protein CDD82_5955 [Ophiocordyceps australis]